MTFYKRVSELLATYSLGKLFSRRILLLLIALCLISGYLIYLNKQPLLSLIQKKTPLPQDQYKEFVAEIYDKIKSEYWDNISDQKLSELFGLAAEKLAGPQITNILDSSNNTSTSLKAPTANTRTALKPSNKNEVLQMADSVIKGMDQKKKKEFVVNLTSAVLANLQPFARSGLYTQKLETQLKNTVNNINPDKDLYKDLGLPKNASEAAVARAYEKKKQALEKDGSEQAKQKLKEIAYAKDTLTDKDTKARYDQAGIEPTVFPKLITSDIALMQFKKFSPTSFDEFQKGLNSLDKEGGPTTLIFDLRGNAGGAIDALPFFMGNFLGANQYIFDFYRKGEFEPYRTALAQLPVIKRIKTMVILVDNQTQSSAELMAASLKRYRMGIVVGVPTKGWGTVERIFPLEHQIDPSEKYSVFLVHRITLRDDNQPIEGRGVEPNVNIKDPDWEFKLDLLVRYPALVSAVKQILLQSK